MNINHINIAERLEYYQVAGLSMAVIENGEISLTKSHGLLETKTSRKVDSQSIFSACSISKFVTSMLVMKLVDQGILHLDEDVNNKLTSWKIPPHEWAKDHKVTLRLLLCHQSGIIDPDDCFSELSSSQEIPSMVELLTAKTVHCKESIKIQYEPGSDFHYSDAGYCIIQLLIEDVIGKPFEVVMKEEIFDTLQLRNSTYGFPKGLNTACGHDQFGKVIHSKYPIYPYPAASGLWTTPADMACLVIDLFKAMKGKSVIGLSKQSAMEMISQQGGRNWTGLGLFLDGVGSEVEISSLGWGVGYQCMMVAFPYLELGAVIMTNSNPGVHQLKGIIGEIYKSFISSYEFSSDH